MKIVCWNRYVNRFEFEVSRDKSGKNKIDIYVYINLNLFKVTGKKNRMKKKKLLKEIIAQIEDWNKCTNIFKFEVSKSGIIKSFRFGM